MSEYLLNLAEKEITRLNYEINDLAAKQRDLMAEREKAINAMAEITKFVSIDNLDRNTAKREPAKRGRKAAAPAPMPETAEKPKRGRKAKANNDATNAQDGFNITENIKAWLCKHKGGVKPQAIVIGIENVHGVTLDTRQVSFTLQALKKRGIVNNDDGFWHYSGKPLSAGANDLDEDHENDQSYDSMNNDGDHENSVAA